MNQAQNTFFDNNMDLLKKNHNHVWNFIQENKPEPVGKAVVAESGQYFLEVVSPESGETVALHCRQNPEQEPESFLAMVEEDSTGVVVLTGMGLGYTPTAILKQRPDIRHLAIFEIEPGIFMHALKLMDLTVLLSDTRTILSLGESPDMEYFARMAMKALRLENIHNLQHLMSIKYSPERYTKLSDMVFNIINDINMDGATKIGHGRAFLENRLAHIQSMHHHNIIEHLQKAFKGVPAIIVAGGPSLDINVHELKEAQGKALILTADSSFPTLLANDITPDFVTAIDFQNYTYEKIINTDKRKENVSLICMPWIGTMIPKQFPAKNVFWCFTASTMEKWMNNMLGGTMLTRGASTVAHLNFVTASVLGCSPIIFVGQDLSYSGEKDHTKHAFIGDKRLMAQTKEQGQNHIEVDAVGGGKVVTNRSFYSFKTSFESMIEANPEHVINSTARGVRIKGSEEMPLYKAIEKYCKKQVNIDEIIQHKCHKDPGVASEKMIKEVVATIMQIRKKKNTIKKSNKLIKKTKNSISKLESGRKKYKALPELPHNIINNINEIDRYNTTLDGDATIWELVEDITYEGIRQGERKRFEIEQIQNDPDKFMEWMIKMLDRFKYINLQREIALDLLGENVEGLNSMLRKERKFLTSRKDDEEKAVFLLAELYYEHKEYRLARPLFEKLKENNKYQADALFKLGCIAGFQAYYEDMNNYFDLALKIEPGVSIKAEAFRNEMAEYFMGIADFYSVPDIHTSKRMLQKGLFYCPGHEESIKYLNTIAQRELEDIGKAATDRDNEKFEIYLLRWEKDFSGENDLPGLIDKEYSETFYWYFSNLELQNGNQEKAIAFAEAGVNLNTDSARLHVMLLDSMFAKGDFEKGVYHLNKAVKIDKNNALYWEKIGDILFNSGQATDAISAYENCFAVLPESIEMLKKIGECYSSLNKPEAAAEAYRQYEQKVGIKI